MNDEGFLPWVGERYRDQPQRLLLLGESHYVAERRGPNLTIELTREYRDGEWSHRYWTGLMQVVEGKPAAEIDRVDFWNRMAFYNFVQSPVDDVDMAPSEAMFKASDERFFEVIADLRPHAILVVSKRLWRSVPDIHGWHPSFGHSRISPADAWIYQPPTPDHWPGAVCSWIPHASRFSWREWTTRVTDLRALASSPAMQVELASRRDGKPPEAAEQG